MTLDAWVMDMIRHAFLTALVLCAPVLLAGAVVGLLVGLLQAVTQVHDQTLSFVPKLVAVLAVFAAMLPWFLEYLAGYATSLFGRVPLP